MMLTCTSGCFQQLPGCWAKPGVALGRWEPCTLPSHPAAQSVYQTCTQNLKDTWRAGYQYLNTFRHSIRDRPVNPNDLHNNTALAIQSAKLTGRKDEGEGEGGMASAHQIPPLQHRRY